MPQLSPSQASHMGQNKLKSHTAELPPSIQTGIFFGIPFPCKLKKPYRTVWTIGGKDLDCVPKACRWVQNPQEQKQ